MVDTQLATAISHNHNGAGEAIADVCTHKCLLVLQIRWILHSPPRAYVDKELGFV